MVDLQQWLIGLPLPIEIDDYLKIVFFEQNYASTSLFFQVY